MHRDGNANSDGTSASTEGQALSRSTVGDSSYEGPISEIWKSLLGLPQISIDDNFFEVGGTSLLATILLKRLNAAFHRELSIATVFEHTTIRAQASLLLGEAAPNAHVASEA